MLGAGEAGQLTPGRAEAAHREGGQTEPGTDGRAVRETFVTTGNKSRRMYKNQQFTI